MINEEEDPIKNYLKDRGLMAKQIWDRWKDSPLRQDLKDIQSTAVETGEKAVGLASKVGKNAIEAAKNAATGRHIDVPPESGRKKVHEDMTSTLKDMYRDAKEKITGSSKGDKLTPTKPIESSGSTDVFKAEPNSKESMSVGDPPKNTGLGYGKFSSRLPKDGDKPMSGLSPGPKIDKPMSGISPAPKQPYFNYQNRQYKREIPHQTGRGRIIDRGREIYLEQTKPQSETPWSGGYHQSLQGTTGSGTVSTGQSGSTGPDYSPTTPKQKSTPITSKSSYESGGKKKMSEETNESLIDMFLKLQEKNTISPNIFEAAKKMKKPNDGNLANNYPPYDKVTRGDVIAGRLGKDQMGGKKKVSEGMYDGKNPFDPKDSSYPARRDPKDPSFQGRGDVTETPPKHVRPTDPNRIKNLKDPRDPEYQGSGEVTTGGKPTRVKEESERFSLEDFIEFYLNEGYDFYHIVNYIEENYQLDEISKETLGSYVTKAARSVSKSAAERAGKVGRDISHYGSPEYEKSLAKSEKRHKGIQLAVDKLANEEVEYIEEVKLPKDVHDKLSRFATDTYEGDAHDLPRHGEHHNDAAIDHVSGRMYDRFHKEHPQHVKHFRNITKKALSGHLDKNEPRISRANDRRMEAKYAKKEKTSKPKLSKPRLSKPKDPRDSYNIKAGYTFAKKPRRGVGSYNEEVEFSEYEIEYFNSVMEAEPVAKTPKDYSDQTGIKATAAGGNITDETIEELSKETLASYALKAHRRGDMAARMSKLGTQKGMTDIANKRYEGVQRAIKKLADKK